MPIIVTFDLCGVGADEGHHNYIRSAFERLGWERLGGSAYRYPPISSGQSASEDWLNYVAPALMLLRSYAIWAQPHGKSLAKFTVDVHSSSGFSLQPTVGIPPASGATVPLQQPTVQQFGEKKLREWIDSAEWPYLTI